jgi:hypothetical protein
MLRKNILLPTRPTKQPYVTNWIMAAALNAYYLRYRKPWVWLITRPSKLLTVWLVAEDSWVKERAVPLPEA